MAKVSDPTSRMTLGTIPKIPENVDSIVSNTPEASANAELPATDVASPAQDEGLKEYTAKKEALKASVDLNEFYFTGKVTHTFKLKKDFEFALMLMDSGALEDVHTKLWELVKNPISDDCVNMAHSKNVLARSLVKYGKKDMSNMSVEDRMTFINSSIPGILIPILMDKYALLEVAVTELFKDDTTIKN